MPRKGLNQGLIGLSSSAFASMSSTSDAETSLGCVNLTKAPPSFSRGIILVMVMGTLSGMARLTRLTGSSNPREYDSNCFWTSARSRLVNHGRQSMNGVSFRGNRSRGDQSHVSCRASRANLLSRNRIDSFSAQETWPLLSSSWIAVSFFGGGRDAALVVAAVLSHLLTRPNLTAPAAAYVRGKPRCPKGRKGRRPTTIAFLLATFQRPATCHQQKQRFLYQSERLARTAKPVMSQAEDRSHLPRSPAKNRPAPPTPQLSQVLTPIRHRIETQHLIGQPRLFLQDSTS